MNNLKNILIKKGIKQSWLAKQLGVTNQAVTNWIKEYSFPRKQNLKGISKILSVAVDEIFFNNEISTNTDDDSYDIDTNNNKNKYKKINIKK